MTNDVNSQYNVSKPDSLAVKTIGHQRRKMFKHFLGRSGLPNASETILDVGATSDQSYDSSNYLEAWYEHKQNITASGIDDASFLETKYPGMRFVKADGLNMPFGNKEFDHVHSSAVLEHVGSFGNQILFIRECMRVAGKTIYLTTPNRWFPVEFHTVLPLVHWLPKPWFRGLMKRTDREFFSEEANLNLMTASEVRKAAKLADPDNAFDIKVETISLIGYPSNLLLSAKRR